MLEGRFTARAWPRGSRDRAVGGRPARPTGLRGVERSGAARCPTRPGEGQPTRAVTRKTPFVVSARPDAPRENRSRGSRRRTGTCRGSRQRRARDPSQRVPAHHRAPEKGHRGRVSPRSRPGTRRRPRGSVLRIRNDSFARTNHQPLHHSFRRTNQSEVRTGLAAGRSFVDGKPRSIRLPALLGAPTPARAARRGSGPPHHAPPTVPAGARTCSSGLAWSTSPRRARAQ
jgi:hypothetical protein